MLYGLKALRPLLQEGIAISQLALLVEDPMQEVVR